MAAPIQARLMAVMDACVRTDETGESMDTVPVGDTGWTLAALCRAADIEIQDPAQPTFFVAYALAKRAGRKPPKA